MFVNYCQRFIFLISIFALLLYFIRKNKNETSMLVNLLLDKSTSSFHRKLITFYSNKKIMSLESTNTQFVAEHVNCYIYLFPQWAKILISRISLRLIFLQLVLLYIINNFYLISIKYMKILSFITVFKYFCITIYLQ